MFDSGTVSMRMPPVTVVWNTQADTLLLLCGLFMFQLRCAAILFFVADKYCYLALFDPNGRQCLTMEGYRDIGQIVRNLADDHSSGRILIVQEGGYHITYSAYCLHATLEGLLNLPHPLLSDPVAYYPEDDTFAVKAIESIKHYQSHVVPFLREA